MSAWMTVAEVADDLGFSPRTILRWVERGELPALRTPGGRLRIPQTALEAWQAARMTSNPARTLVTVDEEACDG